MTWNEVWRLASEQKTMYLLSLICLAMILDLFSGLVSAKIKKEISSKIGINGILRKVASIVLLLFFLPVSVVIPAHAGSVLLYVLYIAYLGLELRSIFENYQKMGIDTKLFIEFIEHLKGK